MARGHHQSGFAGLVHAAEPSGVVAQFLFTDAIILPDLHRLAAARARIAVAGDDDGLLSLPLPVQLHAATAVAHLSHRKARTPATRERSQTNNSRNGKLEFGWHVAVGWQVAVDFETDADFNQNGCRPDHSVLPLDLQKKL